MVRRADDPDAVQQAGTGTYQQFTSRQQERTRPMADNLTQDARFEQALSDQGPDAGERSLRQGLPQQLAQLQTRLDALQHASQEHQQDQGMEY